MFTLRAVDLDNTEHFKVSRVVREGERQKKFCPCKLPVNIECLSILTCRELLSKGDFEDDR